MNTNSQSFGVIIILIGALLIGLMPASAKFAYIQGANPLAVLLGRSVVGVLVLLLFIVATGQKIKLSRATMRRSLVAGVTHVVAALGILASIAYIDISLSTVIIFVYPIPIAVIAHMRGETALTPMLTVLMVLAFAGLVLVLGVSLDALDPRGIALAVVGLVGVVAMIFAMASLTREVGAPHSNLLMTLWAVVIFSAVSLAGQAGAGFAPPIMPDGLAGWLSILAVGLTFSLGYLCFFVSANILGAARASLLSISEPVMIILCAVLLVGEHLSGVQWIGIGLVIGSLAMSEVFRR